MRFEISVLSALVAQQVSARFSSISSSDSLSDFQQQIIRLSNDPTSFYKGDEEDEQRRRFQAEKDRARFAEINDHYLFCDTNMNVTLKAPQGNLTFIDGYLVARHDVEPTI